MNRGRNHWLSYAGGCVFLMLVVLSQTALAQSGGIYIESQPLGARVWINGKAIRGTTPLTVHPLAPGSYVVRIEKEGAYYTATVNVVVGQLTPLSPVLQIKRGRLEVQSIPSGANIVLDGQAEGQTPKVFENISLGQHTLELSKPGFITHRRTLKIQARDQQRRITVNLLQSGAVEVRSDPAGASVYVDGVEMAVTPVRIQLPPGSHTIALRGVGRPEVTRTVQVVPGQDTLVEMNLPQSALEKVEEAQSDARREERARSRTGRSVLAYSTLSVGLGLIGGATAMYILGASQGNEAHDTYSRSTDQADLDHWTDEVEAARTKLIIGNVLAGAGGVMLLLALYQLINLPEEEKPVQQPRNVELIPMSGGAVLSVGTRF
jgi:hypothetical protein